jgi:hypothetical protein
MAARVIDFRREGAILIRGNHASCDTDPKDGVERKNNPVRGITRFVSRSFARGKEGEKNAVSKRLPQFPSGHDLSSEFN